MTTRKMALRSFKEDGVHEEIPQGGFDPNEFKVSQGVQVPPQGDQVRIGGEGNVVPMVLPDITNLNIRDTLLALA